MRSIQAMPMDSRPIRSLVSCSRSNTAIRRVQGTMRSMSKRNFSRCVRFFFGAYSALAKRRWIMSVTFWNLIFLRVQEAAGIDQ